MNPLGGSLTGDATNPSYQNYLAKQILSSSFGHRLHARPAAQQATPQQLAPQAQAHMPYVAGAYADYQYQYHPAHAQYYAQAVQQAVPAAVAPTEQPEQSQAEANSELDDSKKQQQQDDDVNDDESKDESKGESQADEGESEPQGEQREERTGEESDEKRGEQSEANESQEEQKTEQTTAPPTGIEDVLFWSKQYDPNTGHYYYYNSKTRVSQWQKPEGFVESDAPPPPPAWADLSSTVSAADYIVQATFNKQTGRFSHTGTGSYFEQAGRAPDREGRQMSAFFDLGQLERNREEAKQKKQELLSSSIDWRKYKEDRKKKRQKIQNKWLYDES